MSKLRTQVSGHRASRSGQLVYSLACLAGAMVFTGCAARSTARSEILAAVATQRSGRAIGQTTSQNAVAERSDSPVSQPSLADIADPLNRFLALADRDNAAIAASRDNARAVAERVVIVTALPDPTLTTKTLPEPIRTAEGDNHFILNVVQKIPAPEKLDRLGRIALQDLRMAIHAMSETRLLVRGNVKRACYRLFLVRKTTEILNADRDLLHTLIETARAQLRAGKRSQADVLRGQVALASLDARLIELAAKDQTILASLNALLNREPMSPVGVLSEPSLPDELFDASELLAKAKEQNPSLARMADKVEREQQSVAFAKLSGVPDFSLGFEWMAMEGRAAFVPPLTANGARPKSPQLSEAGSDNWGIIFGMTLPIWQDRNKAIVTQAERRLDSTQNERVSTLRAVERDSLDALRRFESQRELTVLYRDAIIPQAEQTYQVSLAGYRGAAVGFDTVIEDHRTWLGLSIRFYQALTEMAVALADLEVATGGALVEP